VGHDGGPVVERIIELLEALIATRGRGVHTFHPSYGVEKCIVEMHVQARPDPLEVLRRRASFIENAHFIRGLHV
jgi:hypothetical protein